MPFLHELHCPPNANAAPHADMLQQKAAPGDVGVIKEVLDSHDGEAISAEPDGDGRPV